MVSDGAPVDIGDDDPIPLAEACALFFRGRIKAATLRAEHDRGNLVIAYIGKRQFVTRRHIREMQEKCQDRKSRRGSGSGQPGQTKGDDDGRQRGSLSTGANSTPLNALLAKLNEPSAPSRNTPTENTSQRASGER